ncbi:hypothetical protein BT63DRAFT_449855 [Microthyrium microscopicum]|uniref:Uncharacterized protein n=1 Tax=Microthyrium microscopicum TaxID=703497 RepID=A0A6A6USX8_9PEZI|nr:hypothetical protein BT63DRAFT_449855 [Microthyrium microscopicum]
MREELPPIVDGNEITTEQIIASYNWAIDPSQLVEIDDEDYQTIHRPVILIRPPLVEDHEVPITEEEITDLWTMIDSILKDVDKSIHSLAQQHEGAIYPYDITHDELDERPGQPIYSRQYLNRILAEVDLAKAYMAHPNLDICDYETIYFILTLADGAIGFLWSTHQFCMFNEEDDVR